MTGTIRVLLLEDDPADATLVQVMLRRFPDARFAVEVVGLLGEAVARLASPTRPDVVLADLSLPDSCGLDTLAAVTAAGRGVPVVVLTGHDNEGLALEALKHGAQDFVVKGSGDGSTLSRAIRYAIERKAAESQLTEALDRAEQAARAKSVFLAMIGHEIRTPLNGILGMARLLLETRLDHRQRTFAETAASSGELLLTLVNDILDFARLDADGLALQPVTFDVLQTVEEVRLMVAARAAEKGLMLSCRFSAGVECVVVGDPLRLRQVLFNLIGNAIKFTDKGGVFVSLDAVGNGTADEPQVLRFSVSDTGIGIPEDMRGNLFTEFWQGEGSSSRRYSGAGLGLAICRRLVTLMGGEIGCDSTHGQGSVFWFTVPLPVSDAPLDDLGEECEAPLPRRRILLVDDNEVNREVAAGLLERRGHEVCSVPGGAEAVEALRGGAVHESVRGGAVHDSVRGGAGSGAAFDLVLLDYHMPGMDGLETARALRALPNGRGLPMFLLTANPALLEEQRWREAGLDGCLGKPFRVDEVGRLIAGLGAGGAVAPPPAERVQLVSLPDLLADQRDLGRDRMVSLVELMRRSSAADLAVALDHARAARLPELASIVHRMASASSSLHLTVLADQCRTIERMARAGNADAATVALGLDDLWHRSVAALGEVLDVPPA